MKAARATVLVIAALAGATLAAAIGIATRPATGAEAPAWHDSFAKVERRATRTRHVKRYAGRRQLMKRRHRYREQPIIRAAAKRGSMEAAAVIAAGGADPPPAVHHAIAELATDTFSARADVTPFEILLLPAAASALAAAPKRERKPPDDGRTRKLCIAAVIAAVVASLIASHLYLPQRGNA